MQGGKVGRTFERAAAGEYRGNSPLYEQLAREVARTPEILEFLAGLPVAQPHLFFAAVQYLRGPGDMPADGAALADFVRENRDRLAAILRERRTQTNETARVSALLPALPTGPIALVEVGAAAGLLLLMDRYRVEYEGAFGIGPADSPVRIRCRLTGAPPPRRDAPEIVWRAGLDRQPIDVRDPGAVEWLVACVWADQAERRRRLLAATALAAADPPPLRRGDLVDDLPALLAEVPPDAHIVVYHSAVLPYVPPERREEFVEVLREASRRRDLTWIALEDPTVLPPPAAPSRPPAPSRGPIRNALVRTTWRAGEPTVEPLGDSHPHGADLDWRSPA